MTEDERLSYDLAEKEDALVALFWEWWVTSTQALVDTIGPTEALKALLPYYINANIASSQILQNYFNEMAKEPDFLQKMIHFSEEAWLGGKPVVRASEEGFEIEIFGCRTRGECKELCQLISKNIPENYLKRYGFIPSVVIEKALFKGDDHCHIVMGVPNTGSEMHPSQMHEIDPPNIDRDVMMSFRLQYVSESWVFTTRAFLDRLDPQITLEKLRMYMRHSGLVYGMKVAKNCIEQKKEASFLGKVIGEINDAHMRRGELMTSPDLVEEVVVECPFAQAPPEVCLQYEAFFKGICEAINPDYEFAYDRMMSTGDKTCHWTICKKGSNKKSAPAIDQDAEEMVKVLKWRLIKGEITPEEFRLLRDVVLEQ